MKRIAAIIDVQSNQSHHVSKIYPLIPKLKEQPHHLCDSKPAPLSQKLAPFPQRKHEQTTNHHAARQQTNTTIDTNALEHRSRKQDSSNSE
jgi:hypothetical protein